MNDRGRRFVPQNGVFGSITVTNNQSSIIPSTAFADSSQSTWKAIDLDTGNVTIHVGHNPTITWNSSNGGTITQKLTAILTAFTCRNQSVTEFKLKGKRWSNLADLKLDANIYLESIDTFEEWTSINLIRVNSCDLKSFQTHEWPDLTEFYVHSQRTDSLPDIDYHDWPKLKDFQLDHNTSMVAFDGKAWPDLEFLDAGYCSWGSVNTANTWTKCTYIKFNNGSNNASLTEIETHPEWVALEDLRASYHNLDTFVTHPEWTSLELLSVEKNFNGLDIVIHPQWTSLIYLDTRSNVMTATPIDDMLIALDGCGTSNGYVDYRLNGAPGQDASRSGSANTAISNLVGKGWTVLR
jgi:hypothetical protein